MAAINASQLVQSGQSFMSLRADPTGWKDGIAVAAAPNAHTALCDVSLKALAIDPTSDFDVAKVVFASPLTILGGTVEATARIVSVGSPLLGTILANPSESTPLPFGQQIGISADVSTIVALNTQAFRLYSFIDPAIQGFFLLAGLPQLIVNAYFYDPPAIPLSRPRKALFGGSLSAFVVPSTINVPFFGRSRFSLSVVGVALAGNATITVSKVFFAGRPIALPNVVSQIATATVVAPGGVANIDIANTFCDALQIVITGTGGDNVRVGGYVADATTP